MEAKVVLRKIAQGLEMDKQELLEDSKQLEATIEAEEVTKVACEEEANTINREVHGEKQKVDNFQTEKIGLQLENQL